MGARRSGRRRSARRWARGRAGLALGLWLGIAAPSLASETLLPEWRYQPERGEGWLARTSGRGAAGLYGLLNATLSDSWHLLVSPLDWRARDWLTFGGVGLATAGLAIFADEEVRRFVEKNKDLGDFGDEIRIPSQVVALGVGGGLFVGGGLAEHAYHAETGAMMLEAYGINAGSILVLKEFVGRVRPDQPGSRADDFAPFDGNQSFPSGETALAFAFATVASERYPHWWVKLGSYGLATAAGLGRIAHTEHWTSDVFAAAAYAIYTSRTIVRLHDERASGGGSEPPEADPLARFVPRPQPTHGIVPRGLGLRWQARW